MEANLSLSAFCLGSRLDSMVQDEVEPTSLMESFIHETGPAHMHVARMAQEVAENFLPSNPLGINASLLFLVLLFGSQQADIRP